MRTRPIRLLVAALAALAAHTGPASGDILSDVGAIPNPFSPNEDGVFDSTAVHYTLSDTAAMVITVADLGLSDIDTVWVGWEGEGEHRHWWGGWVGGTLVGDGDYYFVITAIPKTGGLEEIRVLFTADTAPPTVGELAAAPSRFSPDGDGVGDSVSVSAKLNLSGERDHVLVRVLDDDDESIRELAAVTGVDSVSLWWDGTDDSGGAASDGLYRVRLDVWDDAGNSSWASALVDLDTAPPSLQADLSDPDLDEIRVDTPTASLSGSAYDRGGVVAVELSLDSESWAELSFSGPDTVRWQYDLVCTSCVPDTTDERVTVHIRGRDGTPTSTGDGHVNTEDSVPAALSFDVVFDVAGPVHDSTYIEGGDDTFVAGETIKLSTEWDDAGYTIEADFSLVDSEFDTAEVEWSGSTSGRYSVEYEISTGNSLVPVYDAAIRIRAVDSFGRDAADSSLTVTVLPSSEGPSSLELNRNSFDPARGEIVTISFGTTADDVMVRIYNMAGTLVRTLEPAGASSTTWNGRNEEGELVASGVYFLLIETSLGDATRMVAVVK